MRLIDELEKLDFSMSPNSLKLHEEYQQRIDVLRRMGFIDKHNLGASFKLSPDSHLF